MKVKARHWLNHDGTWYRAGETFEISTGDLDEMRGVVELAETPVTDNIGVDADGEVETVKRRGRPKKSED